LNDELPHYTKSLERGDKTFNLKRKVTKSYIDRDKISFILLICELREYIDNMLMDMKSPRIVKICLYGLTIEYLRLLLAVTENYYNGNFNNRNI